MTPITTAALDIILLVEKPIRAPGIWYAAIDLANAFFFTPICKNHQKPFAFPCWDQRYIFTVLPQSCITSLALCHNIFNEILIVLTFHKSSMGPLN